MPRNKKSPTDTKLSDGDYKLSDGCGWFEVKNFAIRIQSTDEGVVVDIYRNGKECEDAIASTYAFDSEAKN